MATESVTQHHPDEEERAGDLKPAPSMESQKPGISSASAAGEDDEGVEVVLEGKTTLVDDSPPRIAHQQDQNVFRPPRPVRPRAVRAQGGTNGPPPPPPPPPRSGSYGHPPHPEYGRAPYPVPYNPSGSFEDGYHSQTHYSPHVQYPVAGRHPDDVNVNVISPHHRGDYGHGAPRGRYGPPSSHYRYPPSSPVSRPGAPASPPRLRNNFRGQETARGAAQRTTREEEGFAPYPTQTTSDPSRPPVVTESSFDSEHYSHPSHPPTPSSHYAHSSSHDRHLRGASYAAGSFGSFDSHAGPPPHFDDQRYYGHPYPDSPYSGQYGAPYQAPYSPGAYSPGSYYDYHSPYPDYGRPPQSYDHDDLGLNPYGGHEGSSDGKSGMMLPKAAQEVDFDIHDPPSDPVTPPSKTSLCGSPADLNGYDVLCGRGGGTNSQIGNRRFRKLVQEFQPTYLLARRKEKPLLARTIVLIIRKRGGRFLKKDEETGELYEVGDTKAEAKTSQALREGLDVRATTSNGKTKKGKGKKGSPKADVGVQSPNTPASEVSPAIKEPAEKPAPPLDAPPELPSLAADQDRPEIRPPSPSDLFRKRRRMRSNDSGSKLGGAKEPGYGCAGATDFASDTLFSDFCPPRADIGRPTSHRAPPARGSLIDMACGTLSPVRGENKLDDDDIRANPDDNDDIPQPRGCAGIALDIVTGAASGSFCLGPRRWR